MIEPLHWNDESRQVKLLDQTRLPEEEKWLTIGSPQEMAEAIRSLKVRGAPAIGIAAAYGVVLAVQPNNVTEQPVDSARDAIKILKGTRPTAINLFYTLDRMAAVVDQHTTGPLPDLYAELLAEADQIRMEDQEACKRIGEAALDLLGDAESALTHCHTGGLATSGYGTALAPFILSGERGREIHVFVDETRPLLQGSRITAWELQQEDIPSTLIADSMAGHVMAQGRVDAVIVGADRVAANGDVANKIGTYPLAVLADAHDIPFYVAAPVSTIDFKTPNGESIPIEERAADEITHGFGRQTAPDGVQVYSPAFDITPAHLVTALITDRAVVHKPNAEQLRDLAPTPSSANS